MDKITLGGMDVKVKLPRGRKKKENRVPLIKQYQLLNFNEHWDEIYQFSKKDEDCFQAMVCKYVKDSYPDVVIFSIPNGSHKSPQAAELFKLTGLLPGVADLFISAPNKKYYGLYLELKTEKKGSKQSKDQILFQDKVSKAGYLYAIERDLDHCIGLINSYLFCYEKQW